MSGCIFCDIIEGKAKAVRLFESELSIAIMDLRQAIEGHVLVIPKMHIENIYELPNREGADLMDCIVRASRAVRDAIKPDGLSIWQSNGRAAFQEVPHVHFHIHPRIDNDNLLRVYPSKQFDTDQTRLESIASTIRKKLKLPPNYILQS